ALVDDQDRPVLAIGSPGGRHIPNILAGVILRWALHNQDLDEAVAAERFHLESGTLRVESSEQAQQLGALGYEVQAFDPEDYLFGSVQALEIDHENRQVQ